MERPRSFPVCCYCGACAAFIPDFEKYREEEVVWDKGCGGSASTGFCFSFCPRTFAACRLCEEECPRKDYGVCDFSPNTSSPEERILAYYEDIVIARARDVSLRVGPNSGAITAMLCGALDEGFIDAAVIATRTEDWRAEPFVATTPAEVVRGVGPKYTACPSVKGLWEAIDRGYENIAMVGTGCNIEAVRRLQALHMPALELDRVKVLIGLFCTEAFWHRDLVRFLAARDIDIRAVEKFYVMGGNFIVETVDSDFSIPTRELAACVRDTCHLCEDFTAQLADISAGSSGSPEGWTSLIIRTGGGRELVEVATAAGAIETKPMDEAGIEKMKRLAFRKKMMNYGNIMDQIGICAACLTNPYSFTLQSMQ